MDRGPGGHRAAVPARLAGVELVQVPGRGRAVRPHEVGPVLQAGHHVGTRCVRGRLSVSTSVRRVDTNDLVREGRARGNVGDGAGDVTALRQLEVDPAGDGAGGHVHAHASGHDARSECARSFHVQLIRVTQRVCRAQEVGARCQPVEREHAGRVGSATARVVARGGVDVDPDGWQRRARGFVGHRARNRPAVGQGEIEGRRLPGGDTQRCPRGHRRTHASGTGNSVIELVDETLDVPGLHVEAAGGETRH